MWTENQQNVIMLDLQLDEINVINRMDIDIHERRLRQEEEKEGGL